MRSSLDSAATTNSSYSSGSSNSTRSSAIMSPQETTVANQSQMSSRKSGTSFEIYFDDENKKLPARPKSLQKAFETYRNYKLEGQKLHEKSKHLRRTGFHSSPERMWKLRMKFVAQAKKYLGVPYAKKYYNPDTPEYNSDLFLDCCGLVRRVMRDLEKEFGFRIGPGNQAYMFDTLPKAIDDLSQVKPGDLVFISAIYYNEKMKKQPHNITHVEIMLGEGEKTIGARWNNGTIKIFDSYKFEAKSYHSPTYIIKSIDPWLLGLCRSYCLTHRWNYNTTIKNKRSIFYSPTTTTTSTPKKGHSPSARHRHHRNRHRNKSMRAVGDVVKSGGRRQHRTSRKRRRSTVTTTAMSSRKSSKRRPAPALVCKPKLSSAERDRSTASSKISDDGRADDGEEQEDVKAEEELTDDVQSELTQQLSDIRIF